MTNTAMLLSLTGGIGWLSTPLQDALVARFHELTFWRPWDSLADYWVKF